MTIVGIGIDVVEIAPLKEARFPDEVARFFLTPTELAAVPSGRTKAQHLASRFATKEAVIKAFPKTLKPHEFRIEKRGKKPQVVFESSVYNSKYSVLISLTHSNNTAAAVAIVQA